MARKEADVIDTKKLKKEIKTIGRKAGERVKKIGRKLYKNITGNGVQAKGRSHVLRSSLRPPHETFATLEKDLREGIGHGPDKSHARRGTKARSKKTAARKNKSKSSAKKSSRSMSARAKSSVAKGYAQAKKRGIPSAARRKNTRKEHSARS